MIIAATRPRIASGKRGRSKPKPFSSGLRRSARPRRTRPAMALAAVGMILLGTVGGLLLLRQVHGDVVVGTVSAQIVYTAPPRTMLP